ncbi:exodeoxyribonuclease V subunit alpha [Mesoplasma syrphidae]|uniref:Exodeoxyribonuclease V subunit alpha n=1 Tax=Mesoplasma syrphidae TaxID=225999 RepID=A0A2K9BND6_9MOLU|nr:AAA family ATPase [Mesoplasma syrphidae]AUF83553.1 exodeoxyribonuclease V subunit alpha [Mesoplasma syrphidae]
MDELKTLRGYIFKTLYSNADGWGIAIFSSEENRKLQIKIKGNIGLMRNKVLYEIKGKFESHVKFGKTFAVESYKIGETNSLEQTIKYLSSPLFPGVGKRAAETICEYYKINVIRKIKENYDELFQIPGLDSKQAYIIRQQMIAIQDSERLTEIFFENDLKIDILNQMKKHTDSDEEIESIFKNHFYAFATRRRLRSFEDVDKIALHFGQEEFGRERIAYWAQKLATDILMQTGDTYTDKTALFTKIFKTLNIEDESTVIQGILYAKEHDLLILTEQRIYTYESYNDEQIIAKKLIEINETQKLVSEERLELLIDEVEKSIARSSKDDSFKYDEEQRQALRMFAHNKLFILTGGPGTGKTTVIRGMVKLFNMLYNEPSIAIAAPTGRAASRIRESSWELPATTLHRLLCANSNDDFDIDANNPLHHNLIIVDECSMIENRLFSQFIQSIGSAKKIVLVGDVNQLASVGFGNMFEDIIQVQKFPVMILKSIHRQKGGNGIIDLAYTIQESNLDYLDFSNLTNVNCRFTEDADTGLEQVKTIFSSEKIELEQSPLNLQIIAPVYAGKLGIENLNNVIQAEYNDNILDQSKVYDRGRFRYTLKDKIMFLKNDSQLDLANGDIGIIETINFKGDKFENAFVDFSNSQAVLESSNFNDVSLSYACSVHKTQGSEYKKVILTIENGKTAFFLNKKILYTAVTRAKDELFIVGSKSLFLKAAKRLPPQRKTTLKQVILRNSN